MATSCCQIEFLRQPVAEILEQAVPDLRLLTPQQVAKQLVTKP